MAAKKKKKGRQDVKRHWKPSLGRFVEHYDREGENARLKARRAASRTDEVPTSSPDEPRLGRRLVISMCVFGVMLAVIGGFRVKRQGRTVVEYDVLAAVRPVVVRIDHGSSTRVVTASAAEIDGLIAVAVASVRATAAEHAKQLIVIEFVAPVISDDSLRTSDQRAVGRDVYETAVARFIEQVVIGAANPRVSVLGLPVEPGAAGIDRARRTNRRYAGVIKRLDHLVTAHIFFRTESWVTEQRMVEDAIPEALHRADGRPIVFRLNLQWRVVVDRTKVARYRRANWNILASE